MPYLTMPAWSRGACGTCEAAGMRAAPRARPPRQGTRTWRWLIVARARGVPLRPKARTTALATLAGLLAAALAACGSGGSAGGAAARSGSRSGDSHGQLTLYNGQHEQTTQALVRAFEKKTGIKVTIRSDDEDVLVQQIGQEGPRS